MEPDLIDDVFGYIDRRGGPLVVAEVELGLANGNVMTVRAGGGAVTCSPLDPPFTHYEVWIDHDPPRFWQRFGEDTGLTYSRVPRLLIIHQITRSGGVATMLPQTHFVAPAVHRTPVRLPITTLEELVDVLGSITGRPVDANVLKWP